MGQLKASLGQSLAAWLVLSGMGVSGIAEATYFTPMPRSRVDSYRVKSQSGPEIAILNPLFPKESKIEISAIGAWSPFSSLQNYWSYGGALTYHINKRHAIEPVWFQINKAKRTNFVDTQIRDRLAEGGSGAGSDLTVGLPQWIYSASYVFTPFYSKMHVTEMSVAHWDVYSSIGFGLVKSRSQTLAGVNGSEKTSGGAALGLGVRLLVPGRWGFRLDLRDFVHKAENFNKSSLTNTLQLSAGLSIFFSGFPDYTSL
ncbi:MAG TPA: outer membrane beta-barrel domain-containing protein [Bdellovibrionota bacterium]|nr:outer membrane beta-barrel domain-containing protein [Bdellovibrionota bacterium]